ncbi:hypothetical protein Aduo_013308 [Ancylostoma duodenale]
MTPRSCGDTKSLDSTVATELDLLIFSLVFVSLDLGVIEETDVNVLGGFASLDSIIVRELDVNLSNSGESSDSNLRPEVDVISTERDSFDSLEAGELEMYFLCNVASLDSNAVEECGMVRVASLEFCATEESDMRDIESVVLLDFNVAEELEVILSVGFVSLDFGMIEEPNVSNLKIVASLDSTIAEGLEVDFLEELDVGNIEVVTSLDSLDSSIAGELGVVFSAGFVSLDFGGEKGTDVNNSERFASLVFIIRESLDVNILANVVSSECSIMPELVISVGRDSFDPTMAGELEMYFFGIVSSLDSHVETGLEVTSTPSRALLDSSTAREVDVNTLGDVDPLDFNFAVGLEVILRVGVVPLDFDETELENLPVTVSFLFDECPNSVSCDADCDVTAVEPTYVERSWCEVP